MTDSWALDTYRFDERWFERSIQFTRGSAEMALTILGGGLGVGKTTVLNHLLRHADGHRIGVIVNDFGAINIDAQLVVGVHGDMVQLSNGCICCSMRDDLLVALERLQRGPMPPEHIIIEMSGTSNPRRIAAAVERYASAGAQAIDAVVIVIDVEAYLEMSRAERIVAGGQIAAADILILNKIDRVDEARVDGLARSLQKTSRRARVLRARWGQVSAALVIGAGMFDPARWDHDVILHEHEHEHEYWTWSFRTHRPLSARRLRKVVSDLPASVVRMKGLINLVSHPHSRAVMHVVGRRAELCLDQGWGAQTPSTGLVVVGIGPPVPADELEQRFRGCEVEPTDDGFGGVVMRWLRRERPDRKTS